MNYKTVAALGAISPYASIASGLLSGIGSLFGAKNNNVTQMKIAQMTNESNRQIAREANEFNREMYERQYKDSVDFWNMQNQYNDPTQEIQRLRHAGINPAYAFGNGGQSSAAQLPTAPSAELGEPMHAPDLGYQPTFTEGVGMALQNAVSTSKSISEARIMQTNADYSLVKTEADLEKTLNDSKRGSYEWQIAKENLDILRKTKSNTLEQSALQTEAQKESINHMREMIADMQSQRDYRNGMLQLQREIQEFTQEKFAQEYEALCKRIAIEKQNAQTAAYNAQTGRLDNKLAVKQYNYGKKLAFRDYLVNLKRLGMDEKRAQRAYNLARDQFEYQKISPFIRLMDSFAPTGSPGRNYIDGHGYTSTW